MKLWQRLTEHRIEQQAVSGGNVIRELGVLGDVIIVRA
jgi:hypothetical protein